MRRRLKGFTLIEMLGVIAIILILSSIALGVSKYAQSRARRAKAESQLARMVQGYQRYMSDRAVYPDAPSAVGGEYIDATSAGMVDPWGVLYRYRTTTTKREFVVGSFGPDMKPGVANDDDDRLDMQHPYRSNGVDVTLWTEFGYGDDIVMGDCTILKRFPDDPLVFH